jgi:hypothetical protein
MQFVSLSTMYRRIESVPVPVGLKPVELGLVSFLFSGCGTDGMLWLKARGGTLEWALPLDDVCDGVARCRNKNSVCWPAACLCDCVTLFPNEWQRSEIDVLERPWFKLCSKKGGSETVNTTSKTTHCLPAGNEAEPHQQSTWF